MLNEPPWRLWPGLAIALGNRRPVPETILAHQTIPELVTLSLELAHISGSGQNDSCENSVRIREGACGAGRHAQELKYHRPWV